MDAILEQKVESLRRCIQRVSEKTPDDVSRLIDDADLQDILVLNLARAVQLCVDIGSHFISQTEEPAPTTMGSVFTTLAKLNIISAATSESMRKAVGFRNVAVHNYEAINWEIVFAICTRSLDDFRQFAQEIAALDS
ncbi:type VII toxin-antitoxin system HepT family RNase toxin [Chromatocurvus halotolerans]|uniref:Uncharacterized protein DUF86 n=1 Tax=Chromatocurvus halotolerans TaxID=1132028 RepID=A0A4R2L5P1_9GAMM|nr:DUF86 domain-containing protein [Chromatocurvus halotolerans]TCO74485.1 uncharacterized protein DUF86 [Chromatocurvus halotolerans]